MEGGGGEGGSGGGRGEGRENREEGGMRGRERRSGRAGRRARAARAGSGGGDCGCRSLPEHKGSGAAPRCTAPPRGGGAGRPSGGTWAVSGWEGGKGERAAGSSRPRCVFFRCPRRESR